VKVKDNSVRKKWSAPEAGKLERMQLLRMNRWHVLRDKGVEVFAKKLVTL
jgi:hypothetical protein